MTGTHLARSARWIFCAAVGCAPAAGAMELFREDFTPPVGCDGNPAPTWFPDGWSRFNLDFAQSGPVFSEGWAVREYYDETCAASSDGVGSWGVDSDEFMCSPPLDLPEQSWLWWREQSFARIEVRVMREEPLAAEGHGNLLGSSELLGTFHETPIEVVEIDGGFAVTALWELRGVRLHEFGFADEQVFVCFRARSPWGDRTWFDWASLDDSPLAYDARLLSVALPPYEVVPASLDYTHAFAARFENGGALPLSDLSVVLTTSEGDAVRSVIESDPITELLPGEYRDVAVGSLGLDQPGLFTVEARVVTDQGDDAPFDSMLKPTLLARVTNDELSRTENTDGSTEGPIVGAARGEFGHHFDLPNPARIMAARFKLVEQLCGAFCSRVPLSGAVLTARLRGWDAVAQRPGPVLATGRAIAGYPSSWVAPVEIDFSPVYLSAGRYVVTIEDPDLSDKPLTLLHAAPSREAGTSWVHWPDNPLGRWAHFEEIDPANARDLWMSLSVIGPQEHWAVDDWLHAIEDVSLSGSVAANDGLASGAEHVWRLRSTERVQVTLQEDGTFDAVLEADFHGLASFYYEMCVAENCKTARMHLDVAAVDEGGPVAMSDAFVVPSDRAVVLSVGVNDQLSPDRPNRWSVPTNHTGTGTARMVDRLGGVIEYSYLEREPVAPLQDSFEYTLCDSDGDCSQGTVQLDVIPVLFRDSFE